MTKERGHHRCIHGGRKIENDVVILIANGSFNRVAMKGKRQDTALPVNEPTPGANDAVIRCTEMSIRDATLTTI